MDQLACRSARECLQLLRSRIDSWKSREDDRLVFRGEWQAYPQMRTSLSRRGADEQDFLWILVNNLSIHLFDTYVRRVVDMRSDGPFYKGAWLGDLSAAEKYIADPSFLWVHWQLEALLQHYGWPTHWLDITVDPRAALFFASLNYKAGSIATDGMGYIHVWSLRSLRAHSSYFDTPIVELQPIAGLLADVCGVPAVRPGAQRAAAMRVRPSATTTGVHLLDSRMALLSFERGDADEVVDSIGTYFPVDPLSEELEAIEKSYAEWFLQHSDSDTEDFNAALRVWRSAKEDARRLPLKANGAA